MRWDRELRGDIDFDSPTELIERPFGPAPVGRKTPPARPPAKADGVDDGVLRSAPGVHWARLDGELVALDVRTDHYVCLGPYASRIVAAVLGSGVHDLEPQARDVVGSLMARGLVVRGTRTPWTPAEPDRAGGVSGFLPRPFDGNAVAVPAACPGPAVLLTAGRLLADCARRVRTGGLDGLLGHLRTVKGRTGGGPGTRAGELFRAHLTVRRLAGLRTPHPASAPAALARHAWAAGLPARLVFGIQRYPLHARTFVALHDRVLDDAPEVLDALAPILTVDHPARPMPS